MPLIQKRPLTPGQRFHIQNKVEVTNQRPERTLTSSLNSAGGRNINGRITMRRRGNGHKRLYRDIDFKREKLNIPATVQAIEYDPNRTALIALLSYADGEKRYIPAPVGLKVGDTVVSSDGKIDYNPGNSTLLKFIAPATRIHCVEMLPGKGAAIARSAGIAVELMGLEGDYVTVRMPSGEIRKIHGNCRAVIGDVGNQDHQNESLGKAGRNRWLGKRPRVRGSAMNAHDHPQGSSYRNNGSRVLLSPWGKLAKGGKTRKRAKITNRFILIRRNGLKVKQA
jgi:large subunit ribosomal protein L2